MATSRPTAQPNGVRAWLSIAQTLLSHPMDAQPWGWVKGSAGGQRVQHPFFWSRFTRSPDP